MTACANTPFKSANTGPTVTDKPEASADISAETTEISDILSISTENAQTSELPISEEENNLNIKIKIGDYSFSAALYDNETSNAFKKMLPLTLDMSELNGNEKFYYLPDNLPAKSSCPSKIHTGDIMLYGSSCLVLFYEDFSTSYSYTAIGRIDDPNGLSEALGAGNISVIFE